MLRKLLLALGGLVGLLLVLAISGFAISSSKLKRTYDIAVQAPAIPNDSASIARGRHLARAITKCVECHGDDFSGKVVIPEGPLGLVAAPNLTTGRGGVGAQLEDADFVRAVRHGVGRDGRGLILMPSEDWVLLADDDLAAIVAYVRSLPPVDNELPRSKLGPLGRGLYVAGQLPLFAAERVPHDQPVPAAPAAGATTDYGRYLANIGGCTGCHGPGLSGGKIPGTPPEFKPAANLTPEGIGRWSEEDFFRALREGKRPDGTAIDPFMPWRVTREMTDEEIRAVWAYLRTVEAKAYGNR